MCVRSSTGCDRGVSTTKEEKLHFERFSWVIAVVVLAVGISLGATPAVQQASNDVSPIPGREFAAALNVPAKGLKVEGLLFLPSEVKRLKALVVVIGHG